GRAAGRGRRARRRSPCRAGAAADARSGRVAGRTASSTGSACALLPGRGPDRGPTSFIRPSGCADNATGPVSGREPGPMPHRLLLAALAAATVFPSTAAAAVCGAGTGAWQAAPASGSADRTLPASTRMRVDVRTQRTGGEQRVVALRTNRLAVTRGARGVALRTASGRTLVAVRAGGRGWAPVEAARDARPDRRRRPRGR